MKKLLFLFLLCFPIFAVNYVSSQNGDWNSATTWGGAGTPADGDTVRIRRIDTVTITENAACGSAGATGYNCFVDSGKCIINTGCTLTVKRDAQVTGTLYQNAGSGYVAAGSFYVRMGNGSYWTIAGTSNSRASVRASSGGLAISYINSSHLVNINWNYVNASALGQSSSIHAIFIGSGGVNSMVRIRNSKFSGCYQFTFDGNGSEGADYEMGFDSCTFIAPAYTRMFKFSSNVAFNAGKKYITNCVFVGTGSENVLYDTRDADIANPFLFTNNVLLNCINSNVSGTHTKYQMAQYSAVTGNMNTFGTKRNKCIMDSSVVYSNKGTASHSIQLSVAARVSTDTMKISNSFFFPLQTNSNSGNAIMLYTTALLENNVTIGGNGYYFQDAGDGVGLVDINKCTHFEIPTVGDASGNRDAMFLTEVATTTDTITLRNLLLYGTNVDAAPYEALATGYAGTQTIKYSDYHNVYNVHPDVDKYIDIANPSHDSSANDVSINPMVSSSKFDSLIEQFGALNGLESPTLLGVFSEMVKMNGFDKDGNPATFNAGYDFRRLRRYLRWAVTPHNTALRGVGQLGTYVGAYDVVDTLAVKKSAIVAGVDSDTIFMPCSLSTAIGIDSARSILFVSTDKSTWTRQDSTAFLVGGSSYNLVYRDIPSTGKYYVKDSVLASPLMLSYGYSFIDSAIITSADIVIDSVVPDTILAGDSITIYGENFAIIDSMSGTIGGDPLNFVAGNADTIRIATPTNLDTGFYTIVLTDGNSTATKVNAFYVKEETGKDTVISCYPRKIRSDVTASLRMITIKYRGVYKATINTIIHLGSVSLGQNAAYTDSTVIDTVFGCPSGYYRGFLTDLAYIDMSDTVLNILQVLTPTGTVTNPR